MPSWQAPPDPAAANVVLEPGLAFGTGEHPTTRLCLRWLKKSVKGGERVMDYGCGCGRTDVQGGHDTGSDLVYARADSGAADCRRSHTRPRRESATRSIDTTHPPSFSLLPPDCRSSGVLAVAALLLGADRSVGLDVDPLAVKSSGDNAKLNGARKTREGLCRFSPRC